MWWIRVKCRKVVKGLGVKVLRAENAIMQLLRMPEVGRRDRAEGSTSAGKLGEMLAKGGKKRLQAGKAGWRRPMDF
ncbi:hypothetical protein GCM10022419_103870 [Nonomuraea rosea]|uniref:Uncharacterized protein n=1 Tax=Nonomuraea rosea TaxID=638574 RepID=A0ABP6Z9V2_9ACTN